MGRIHTDMGRIHTDMGVGTPTPRRPVRLFTTQRTAFSASVTLPYYPSLVSFSSPIPPPFLSL